MKFTKIPVDTFQKLQRNAGILCTGFSPATGAITGILGATTGGVQFTAAPSYTDFGDDIDNCPKNMLELKNLDSIDVTLSGTLLTIDAAGVKRLIGAADIDSQNDTHIIPRRDLLKTDYNDIWWVGDYSDENTGDSAGFFAIHVMNALNTGGLSVKSADKAKGQFAFTFTGHVSMDAQDVVPYEVYIQSGSGSVTPSIFLNKHSVGIAEEATETLTVSVVPSDAEVTWTSGSDSVATVDDGVVTGVAAGDTIITASITVDDVEYTDTCTVIVTAG